MSSHISNIVGTDGGWQAKCSCRSRSPVAEHRWAVEDWQMKHLRQVERARASLSRSSQSLAQAQKFYAEQAERKDIEPAEREQWQALADEAAQRLGLDESHETLPLWD